MKLTDQLLLQKIIEANLYQDKLSLEKHTSIQKPKYKLARKKILEDFLFHYLTTTKNACKKTSTITIKKQDWEDIASDEYLWADCSYCDISKYDLINEEELLKKIKDKNNGFPYVARMPIYKYKKLLKLCKKIKYILSISNETKEIIESSLHDIADEKLRQIGLD